jgi:NAD(P)-dependent dehydrogenase (short-subunit alcohol dehydrogenase family)
VTDDTRTTRDGFELTFGVNHLAHFLLVELLRPRLEAPARIVMISSGTHFGTLRQSLGYRPDWRSPDELARPAAGPRPAASGRTAYATSKLATIHHVHELARRLPPGITANAFDPGLMPGTGLARDFPAPVRAVWDRLLPRLVPLLPFAATPQESGEALAALAADPAWDGVSGAYVEGRRAIRSSPASYDAAREAELWARSEVLTGLTARAAASSPGVRAA